MKNMNFINNPISLLGQQMQLFVSQGMLARHLIKIDVRTQIANMNCCQPFGEIVKFILDSLR